MTTCPHCADPIEEALEFCPHCGESLEGGEPSVGNPFAPEADESQDPPRSPAGTQGVAGERPVVIRSVEPPSVFPSVKRPGGVTVYAWADSILGGLVLLIALGLIVLAIGFFISSKQYSDLVGVVCLAIAGVSIVIGGPLLAMGLGLFRTKRWARILGLVVSGSFAVAGGLEALFLIALLVERATQGGRWLPPEYFGGAIGSLLGFAFFGGQFFVLMRPEAKDAFDDS